MKKFVVKLSDKNKELMNKELIIGHVEYLKYLKNKGVLPICGPCTDGSAIMIFEVENKEEVLEFVEGDPFTKANYYKKREVTELCEATLENNFLLDEVLDYLENNHE